MPQYNDRRRDNSRNKGEFQKNPDEIGALWWKEGKEDDYLTGIIETEDGEKVRFVCFPNKYKKGNAPDFRIMISKIKESREEAPARRPSRNNDDRRGPPSRSRRSDDYDDEPARKRSRDEDDSEEGSRYDDVPF
jgi:hypothetical protein